jgi:hypothetical protein
MDFYSKYLKYKNKYLELKNQLGGALQQRQSNRNHEYENQNVNPANQTTNQLVNLDINCRDLEGINRYRLARNRVENQRDNEIYYNYRCSDNNVNNNDRGNRQQNTQPNNYGNGQLIYLDRHEINCHGTAIKDMQLQRNGDRIHYNYKCGNIPLRVSREDNRTGLNESGGNIFLDRHDTGCNDEEVLTKIRLNSNHVDGQPSRIEYVYTCGKSPIKIEIIPNDRGDTFSWLWVPLIYNVLTDITIRFPERFETVFNEFYNGYANRARLAPGFNNYETFNTFLAGRLRNTFGILTRAQILARTNPLIFEDGDLHLNGVSQDHVLGGIREQPPPLPDGTVPPAIYIFAGELSQFCGELARHLCREEVGLRGQRIFFY